MMRLVKCVEQREELETSKVYCRRKVENNWEKYEEPAASTETETDLSLHGADYQQLLNATCAYTISSYLATPLLLRCFVY